MSDLEALIESVLASPEDYAPRGVLADCLDEHDDIRADTVRRAPDALRAMIGFPDAAKRLANCVRLMDAPTYRTDGTGVRSVRFEATGDEWPYMPARLDTAGMDVFLWTVYVSREMGKSGGVVYVKSGATTLIVISVPPNGAVEQLIDPCIRATNGLGIVVKGDGRFSINLMVG